MVVFLLGDNTRFIRTNRSWFDYQRKPDGSMAVGKANERQCGGAFINATLIQYSRPVRGAQPLMPPFTVVFLLGDNIRDSFETTEVGLTRNIRRVEERR